jgi:hypothetical protein
MRAAPATAYAGQVHPVEQRGDRAVAGQVGVGVEVVPGHQDEGALVGAGVRQHEARRHAERGDDVDVERARAPAHAALTAGELLCLLRALPRRTGGQAAQQDGVEELALGHAAHRDGLVDG